MTIPRFDIFRIDKDGGLCWIGAADDVGEAQKLITRQQASSRDYVLFDLRTGAKKEMKTGALHQEGH